GGVAHADLQARDLVGPEALFRPLDLQRDDVEKALRVGLRQPGSELRQQPADRGDPLVPPLPPPWLPLLLGCFPQELAKGRHVRSASPAPRSGGLITLASR